MSVVKSGDWISISTSEPKTENIKWQQNLVERNKDFQVMPFTVIDGDASGTLFIESGLASKFLALTEKDDTENPFAATGNYKVQVTDLFQYGQDKKTDPTIRFLVFHDHDDNIYQHRFMQTQAFSSIMYTISDKVGVIPEIGPLLKKVSDYAKAFVGDPLRDFEKEKEEA